jgi:hypothetical protein
MNDQNWTDVFDLSTHYLNRQKYSDFWLHTS